MGRKIGLDRDRPMISLICNSKKDHKRNARYVGKPNSFRDAIFWNVNIYSAINVSNTGQQFQLNVHSATSYHQLYSVLFMALPAL